MRNLVIVPNVANNRERMNLGEFANLQKKQPLSWMNL